MLISKEVIDIKAQIATEYLIIIGLVLLFVIPLTLLYAKYSAQSSYAITTAQVDAISNQIIGAANQVNVYGQDTQVSLKIDFPDRIKSLEFNGKEIIFTVLDEGNQESQIVKVADVPLEAGIYDTVTPGRKSIIVKSLGNTVAIQFGCKTNSDCGSLTCLNSICT